MIDYEKLQQAYKLYPMGQLKVIPIFDYRGNLETFNYSMEIENVMADYFFSIDDLIKKLQELTQSKPKYAVGQEVWFMDCSKRDGPIASGIVEGVETSDGLFGEKDCRVRVGEFLIPIECVAPSKLGIIEMGIDYWQRLKLGETSTCSDDVSMPSTSGYDEIKCEHANDGHPFSHDAGMTETFRCKKCGEFYK